MSKKIETVYGDKEITVKALTRHGDQIKIPKCGAKGTGGAHVVTIQVEYPADISKVIEVLQNGVSNPVKQ